MTQALNQRSMQYYCCYSQYRESHLTWTPIAHREGVYLLLRATVVTFDAFLGQTNTNHIAKNPYGPARWKPFTTIPVVTENNIIAG